MNSIRDPDVSEEIGEAYNAYVDEKGRMDVFISVAGQRLMPPQKLDIVIAFTAYRSKLSSSQIFCRLVRMIFCWVLNYCFLPFVECKNDGDGFKKCKDDSDICIWDGLFHDKIINCPFNDCLDEGGCPVISSGMC